MSSNGWSSSFAAARSAPALPGRRAGAALVRAGELLLLLALTLPVRLLWLEADAHIDELYHLLAAEGWLASGEPRIGSGLYGRAFLFTALVGWFMDVLGHSLQVARLPSVVAGTALVLAVFLWTRRLAGPLAGWSAALLLAWSPLAVELSQLARFYALHALALWLACAATQHPCGPPRPSCP
jgi:predicted membrane-bound mannosyltransferase